MPADALKLEEIIFPPYFVFLGNGYMNHPGPELYFHIYYISVESILKDSVAFAYGQRVSYRPALRQNITESGSIHFSLSCGESMSYDSDR